MKKIQACVEVYCCRCYYRYHYHYNHYYYYYEKFYRGPLVPDIGPLYGQSQVQRSISYYYHRYITT